MRYGLDFERLWYWYGPQANLNKCAQWSVVDCDVDYLRVAINCAYELQEGTYDLNAYTKKIIPMMTTMKNANPNIKFFGSPRPLNEAVDGARWQPYPTWITGDNGSSFSFKWEKCAQYLLRYLILMDSYGFKMSYLDVTNEWQNNYGGRIEPPEVKYIRNYLIDNLPANIEMPLIVAPSAWSFTQGTSFISNAASRNVLSGFDIAACHNTGYQGEPIDFASKAIELGKDVWDSEVHGWKGKVTADEIPTSHQMFDRIRAGFSGLNGWLAIGTTKQQHCYFLNNGSTIQRNVKYYIFQKLSTTSNYGHALDVNLPDEFTSTSAFIKDDLLTVWILNNSSVDVSDVDFLINDKTISGGIIRYTKWHPDIAVTGLGGSLNKSAENRFVATINANSLYCFEMYINGVNTDAFSTIEAESYSDQSGIDTEDCTEGTQNIGWIHNGDWCAYYNVDFGIGVDSFIVRAASRTSGGNIEIRLDSVSGQVIGVCPVTVTGNWQNWMTSTVDVSNVSGVHDVYLVFTGSGTGYLFNMNWFTFTPSNITGDFTSDGKVNLDDFAELSGGWQLDYTMDDLIDIANDWLSGTARFSSLWFDGGDDYVEIPGFNGITGSDSRACAAWIKTTTGGDILGWGNNLAAGTKWRFRVLDSGLLAIQVGGSVQTTSATVNDGNWHHVAVVLPAGTAPVIDDLELYIDGIGITETTSSSGTSQIVTGLDNIVKIGVFDYLGAGLDYFEGQIDDVRIYDRGLSDVEVGSIANITDGLVAHWNLNEGSGDIAYDSVSGYTGTVNGAQWDSE